MTASTTSSARPLRLVPACGEQTALTPDLVHRSIALASPSPARAEAAEVLLRCALQVHTGGEHHAFVMQLNGMDARAVWASWTDEPPTATEVRDDCEAVSPPERGSQPCCEFAGHPGAHTYDVHDPWVRPGLSGN